MTFALLTVFIIAQPALAEPIGNWRMLIGFSYYWLKDEPFWDFNNDGIVNWTDYAMETQ